MPETFQAPNARAEIAAKSIIGRILIRHRDSVEDVLQNARLKAFQHSAKFEGRSAYSSWFYRVAMNEALMHVRQKDTKRLVSGLEEFDRLAEGLQHNGLDPLQRLLHRERRQQLIRAILQLTPKLRAAILKYAIRNRMDTDTSKLDNNEKSRVFRALRLLREKLEAQEHTRA